MIVQQQTEIYNRANIKNFFLKNKLNFCANCIHRHGTEGTRIGMVGAAVVEEKNVAATECVGIGDLAVDGADSIAPRHPYAFVTLRQIIVYQIIGIIEIDFETWAWKHGGSIEMVGAQSGDFFARHSKTALEDRLLIVGFLRRKIADQNNVAAPDCAAALNEDFLTDVERGRHIVAAHHVNPVAKHKPQHHGTHRRKNQRQ